MTLLGFDGMTALANRQGPEWLPLGTFQFNTTGRDGSANGASGVYNAVVKTWTPPGGVTLATAFCGFGYSQNTTFAGTNATHRIIGWETAGAVLQTVLVYNTSGMIEARRTSKTGTLLATSTGHLPVGFGTWQHFQTKFIAHTTAGVVEVKLNDVTVLSFTGATSSVNANVTALSVGALNSGGNDAYSHYDDWYVNDDVDATATQGRPNRGYLGNLKVQVQVPNAVGDTTQWTPTTAVPNYSTVDEIPANATDYVGAAAGSALRDLYGVSDLPVTAAAVYGVRQTLVAATSDAGAASVTPVIKENNVVTSDGSRALTTTYVGYYGGFRYTRPSDSAPWTVADANALQVGQDAA